MTKGYILGKRQYHLTYEEQFAIILWTIYCLVVIGNSYWPIN